MAEIRALSTADLPEVTALVEARLPGWTYGHPLLFESLLEHPWTDPELPSLVAVDEAGAVIGFMGAYVRRLRLGDRTLRGVCCSHLVVADDPRVGLAGTLLLRRMLLGPQDVSWTDSATDTVVRMWAGFGGYVDNARSADWMLVLRPLRWLPRTVASRARGGRPGRDEVPVGALPFQALGARLLPDAFPALGTGVEGRDADSTEIAAVLPELSRKLKLWVDHDEAHLESLFGVVRRALGSLVTRIVYREGRPIGWYAYVSRPGGVSRVLHLCALPADSDDVLGEVVQHARAGTSAVITGRAEPHLRHALQHRFAVLGFARQPVLHVRDVEIRALLATDAALMSHLEGEWFAN